MSAAPDLFATKPPPPERLAVGDELALYYTDHAAWCARVAPRYAAKLAAAGVGSVRAAWPYMGDVYRAAVWNAFTPDQQQRLRSAGIPPPVPP